MTETKHILSELNSYLRRDRNVSRRDRKEIMETMGRLVDTANFVELMESRYKAIQYENRHKLQLEKQNELYRNTLEFAINHLGIVKDNPQSEFVLNHLKYVMKNDN